MRPSAKLLALTALLGSVFAVAEVRGQPARTPADQAATQASPPVPAESDSKPKSPAAPAGPKKPGGVSEEPSINYVRDKDGRLVPLLGFTWEELQEFHRQKQAGKNAQSQPRPFDLQQMVIAGQAKDNRVELTATYQVRIDEDKWTEVPLVGGGAVLAEPAVYKGPGEHVVKFDNATGAYTAQLRGPARSLHELTIKYFAPLKNVNGQRRLELELPAAAASRLSIDVPYQNATVTASTGAVTADVKRLGGGKSEIQAWGLGGPVSLAWKEGAGTVASATSRLDAVGQILVELDSHSVRFDATLEVSSKADDFDRFQVRLPPGATRIVGETTNANYTLSGGMEEEGVVSVQLAQKTKGPVKVQIQAERAYDATDPTETLELAAGFEVVEALPHRQWGHIAVVLKDDWSISVVSTERVQQVEELPSGLQRDGASGFEYFGRPSSLAVKVSPRETWISVDPEYRYFVEPDRIRLEAKLKYVIRGAKAYELAVEMPGWKPIELEPREAIESELFWSADGPLQTIPLIQGVNGKFELTIVAQQRRSADSSNIEINLPMPHAAVVEPALVIVQPEDNVRLRPTDDAIVGLSRLASAGTVRLPQREQSPLVYRADRAQGKFVAVVERLPQTVRIAADGSIDVRQDNISVEQHFQYRVEHDPLDSITLEVPRQVADGKWEVSINDAPVAHWSTSPPVGESDAAIIRVPLFEPRSGDFTVNVSFRLPLDQVAMDSDGPVRIPLVMPQAGALTSNRLTITRDSSLRVNPYDDLWTQEDEMRTGTDANGVPALRLTAERAMSEILLAVGREVRQSTGSTVVERGWVQSWIAGGVRQDRAVYRLTSSEEQISFLLPAGNLSQLQIKINDAPVTAQPDVKGAYTVRLPEQRSSHTLAITYQVADDSANGYLLSADLPRFTGNVGVQHLYWQLAMPGDRHLIEAPDRMTPEFTWQWSGFGWHRRSSIDHDGLQQWIGVKMDARLPPSTNQYLFSTAGSPEQLDVLTAGRGELVFASSLAALLLGLAVIYFRLARRPIALFAVGLLIGALAIWKAELAVLFAQAALLGVALALLAMLLEYLHLGVKKGPVIVRSGGSSIIESRPAATSVRVPQMVSPASTDSLPIEMEVPAAESTGR